MAFQLLVKSQTQIDRKLDCDKLLKYLLMSVTYSIGLADRVLAKKASNMLWMNVMISLLAEIMQSFISADENAVFHCFHNIPLKFGEILFKVFGFTLHLSLVISSTDMYKGDCQRSGTKQRKCWRQTKHGWWKIKQSVGKTPFIQILLSTWRSGVSTDIHTGHHMVLICDGKACRLTSDRHNTFC